MGKDLDWKSSNVKPEDIDAAYRTTLAKRYEEAIEKLYQADNKTKWYNSSGEEEKPSTLFESAHSNNEGKYADAAHIINTGWDDSGGDPQGSAEDLVARFKSTSIIDVAAADYQKFLVAKLTADDSFLSEGESSPDNSESDYTDPSGESLTDTGVAEIDKIAAEEAAAAAKAAKERIEAQAAEATAAAKSTATSATSLIEMQEQCFLLAFITKILEAKEAQIDETEVKPIPYHNGSGNACLMAHSEPFGFMNLLTQYSSQRELLDMTTAEIGALQPKIQLYKVMKDDEGEEISVPVTFDSYLKSGADASTASDLFKNKKKRGVGAGLKSFTFAYEGNNPFAVKKSITAKLSIFANTFDELSTPRGNGNLKYNYLDLALKTGGAKLRSKLNKLDPQSENKGSNLAKLDFRLKAIVGWAQPPAQSGIVSAATRDAINHSFVTLNLTPVIHNFDFDDRGRVTFDIEYFAYVEDFYNQPSFSIFSDPEVLKNQLARQLKYASLTQDCKAGELSKIRKSDKEAIVEDRTKALNWISRTLSKSQKIRYITLEQAQLKKISKEGPFADTKQIFTIKTIQGAQEDKLKEHLEDDTAVDEEKKPPGSSTLQLEKQIDGESGTHNIIFFFVSDLIDIILGGIGDTIDGMHTKVIDEIKASDKDGTLDSGIVAEHKAGYKQLSENFKRLRVMLGPIEIVHPTDPSRSMFKNLGDIPVSLKYFMEFLTEKTLKKDQIFYPLPSFLNDFFNVFLRTFLNDGTCFNNSAGMKQRVRLSQASLTDYKRLDTELDTVSTKLVKVRAAKKNDKIRSLNVRQYKSATQPLLNISGYRVIEDAHKAKGENDYLVYYASRAQPVKVMAGDEEKDQEAGVFHYRIGKDRGIVKTIRLSRTEMPGLKEARFEGGGYDGLEQMREVYNVDIDTFANVSTYPGTYIFVNPLGFAPNMKSNIGQTAAGEEAGDQFDVSNLTDYGLGGYYMIIRSTHTFGPGQANTSITARWVMEIEKAEQAKEDAAKLDEGTERPKKCTVGPSSTREGSVDASVEPELEESDASGDGDAPPIDSPDATAPDPPV